MRFKGLRAVIASIALVAAACSGSDIASPGASGSGTPPGGGGGGGSGGGGGTGTCPSGFTTLASVGGLTVCQIAGAILSNFTIPNVPGVAYRISDRVDVGLDIGADGNKAGGQRANLTIEPGVVLFGASGADYLVVNRGSQLIADGTETQPIIFTSQDDLEDANFSETIQSPTPGRIDAISEWGGIVILGRGPIKNCSTGTAGGTESCEAVVEGVSGAPALYGGALANDRSGTLRYVQVRHAGFPLPGTAGNELNGITFGGVGSDTTVDFVQVHNNSDDGVEFFGGTVNVRHLVLTGNDDDSIDTDTGYTGNLQFVLIRQRSGGGDNVFEASSAGASATPVSHPTIVNFTSIGARANNIRANSGTDYSFVNGIVVGATQCFNYEASAGTLAADSTLFDCATVGNAAAQGVIDNGANNILTANSLSGVFPGPTELARNATAVDPTTLGSFFQPAQYIGAFGPDENESDNWAAGWTYGVFASPPCPTGTTETGTLAGQRQCTVSGVITSDLRLVRGNVYQLSGRVDVGVDDGPDGADPDGVEVDLSIDSGVIIFGSSGADYVVVNRGSRIFANGTPSAPVVFTSARDLNNTQPDPINAIGEWGGVVILGQGPIKNCSTGTAGGTNSCEAVVEGVSGAPALYGGADSADDSGRLSYVQVKYAGFPLPGTAGNELNGITFGGVGSTTQVDHIQVHNNADDGVEFFGGTVNVRHLVLTGNDDDSIDTDAGYVGAIQFAIVVQRSGGGDNVFEASGSGAAASPASNYVISNFTVVGNRTNAFRLNSGTIALYANGVVDYGLECFRWETSAGNGDGAFQAGADPTFRSVMFDCDGGLATSSSAPGVPAAAVGADPNNTTDVATTLANTFVNGPNESARTFVDPTTLHAFFVAAPYVGAVRDGADNWWRGWTCGLETGSSC